MILMQSLPVPVETKRRNVQSIRRSSFKGGEIISESLASSRPAQRGDSGRRNADIEPRSKPGNARIVRKVLSMCGGLR